MRKRHEPIASLVYEVGEGEEQRTGTQGNLVFSKNPEEGPSSSFIIDKCRVCNVHFYSGSLILALTFL